MFSKYFTLISIALLLVNCNGDKKDLTSLFSISITNQKKTFTQQDALEVEIKSKDKGKTPEAVSYYFEHPLSKEKTVITPPISLSDKRLGKHLLYATITYDGTSATLNTPITIVASQSPQIYTYTIEETYPHDIAAYTQGLEFKGDTLYESTGQYGESTVRMSNYKTGELITNKKLEDQYFGEGLTLLHDKVYQLTWRKKKGFVYNAQTLEKEGEFPYKYSQQGWGLCNDGNQLYKSDGTERIWTLDAKTQAEKDFIEVYTNRSKIDTINELEWVENKIYANIYRKDAIAIVNPESGAVEGVINLKGLKSKVSNHPKIDVLNGIAYKGEKDILYITGKNWDKLFKIKIQKK